MVKKLTKYQKSIWTLHSEGKSIDFISSTLGITKQSASNALCRIRAKIGVKGSKGHPTEELKPDIAAYALEAAADPMTVSQKAAIAKINEDMKQAGLPGKVSQAVVRRMMVKFGNAVTVKRAYNTKELIESLDRNLYLIDSYMDDKVVAEASLRDLGLVKAALIEKRNLLKGEPTAIISDKERAELVDLIPEMIQECQRRGLTMPTTVEGEVLESTVSPR